MRHSLARENYLKSIVAGCGGVWLGSASADSLHYVGVAAGALPRWTNIRYTVDALRRQWLVEVLSQ